jgi:hypothetical protein
MVAVGKGNMAKWGITTHAWGCNMCYTLVKDTKCEKREMKQINSSNHNCN